MHTAVSTSTRPRSCTGANPRRYSRLGQRRGQPTVLSASNRLARGVSLQRSCPACARLTQRSSSPIMEGVRQRTNDCDQERRLWRRATCSRAETTSSRGRAACTDVVRAPPGGAIRAIYERTNLRCVESVDHDGPWGRLSRAGRRVQTRTTTSGPSRSSGRATRLRACARRRQQVSSTGGPTVDRQQELCARKGSSAGPVKCSAASLRKPRRRLRRASAWWGRRVPGYPQPRSVVRSRCSRARHLRHPTGPVGR